MEIPKDLSYSNKNAKKNILDNKNHVRTVGEPRRSDRI